MHVRIVIVILKNCFKRNTYMVNSLYSETIISEKIQLKLEPCLNYARFFITLSLGGYNKKKYLFIFLNFFFRIICSKVKAL